MSEVMLDLSPGAVLIVDAVEWTVELFEPHFGRVLLARADGSRLATTVRFLVNLPGCRPSSRSSRLPAADRGRQPKLLADLPPQRREQVALRVARLLEVETGYRGGDPLRLGPGRAS